MGKTPASVQPGKPRGSERGLHGREQTLRQSRPGASNGAPSSLLRASSFKTDTFIGGFSALVCRLAQTGALSAPCAGLETGQLIHQEGTGWGWGGGFLASFCVMERQKIEPLFHHPQPRPNAGWRSGRGFFALTLCRMETPPHRASASCS